MPSIVDKSKWYDLGWKVDLISLKKKKKLLLLLTEQKEAGGELDIADIASKLKIPEERLNRYLSRIRDRKAHHDRRLRRTDNSSKWLAVLTKETSRRVGSTAPGVWRPIPQAIENLAESSSKTEETVTLANMYQYIALAASDRPKPACTELMGVLFKYFLEKLSCRLETSSAKELLIELMEKRGKEIAEMFIKEEAPRVYWTGQGRPPPGYSADAYTKVSAAQQAMNVAGGLPGRAMVILNCLDLPTEPLKALSDELSISRIQESEEYEMESD